jgi:hypothetical protein
MSESVQVKIAPTRTAPVKAIHFVKPNVLAESVKCEGYVNLGFFFDGTDNNSKNDKAKRKNTNIARLFDTYRTDAHRGYFKTYVPGVGTPFAEIGEFGTSKFGSGFGIGCEARVLFAMLFLFNSIHKAAFSGESYFSDEQVRMMCSVGKRARASHSELAILAKLGLEAGLLMPDFFGKDQRDDFFLAHSQALSGKLAAGAKFTIKECFLDVFGFSRGAAEARVFCSWLDRILVNRKFAGIPLRFRFVGLMDTVASGGFWSSVKAGITNTPDGHSGWAEVEYLRLQHTLENCVHMVAMHELRKNFPLDEAGVSGVLPPNTQEFVYPGTHSDVGGGYEPGELGVSVGKDNIESDALKLSQIPLNHMLECAIAAGSPMDKSRVIISEGFDPFAISPVLAKAYLDFLGVSSMAPRPLSAWLQPYLNWRWQKRLVYSGLSHLKKAGKSDREVLEKFNKVLVSDAELITRMSGAGKTRTLFSLLYNPSARLDAMAMSMLDKEANAVLEHAKNAPQVDATLHNFFDNYVHDSLAGFDSRLLEPTGYWRYRKGFVGGVDAGIVINEQKNDDTQIA